MDSLSVIGVGGADGSVRLLAHGVVELASLSVGDGAEVVHLNFQGLDRLVVLYRDEGGSRLAASVFDCAAIAAAAADIRLTTDGAFMVLSALSYADKALQLVRAKWAEGFGPLAAKWAAIEAALVEHGSALSPADELLALLGTGVGSLALTQVITSTLGHQALAKLSKGLDAACASVLGLAQRHLGPALEHVLYHLAEMRGLTHSAARTGQPCPSLDPAALSHMLDLVAAAQIALQRLVHATAVAGRQFRAFTDWLAVQAYTLAGEEVPAAKGATAVDLAAVVGFLGGNLASNPVSTLLASAVAAAARPATPEPAADDEGRSLVVALETALRCDWLSSLSASVSPRLPCVQRLILLVGLSPSDPPPQCDSASSPDAALFSILPPAAPTSALALLLRGSEPPTASLWTMPGEAAIASAELYGLDSVAMLMRAPGSRKTTLTVVPVDGASYVQVPVANSPSVYAAAAKHAACQLLPERSRSVVDGTAHVLAVSAGRRVGAVISNTQRVLFLDLDEDEAAEEADE